MALNLIRSITIIYVSFKENLAITAKWLTWSPFKIMKWK